MKVFLVPCALAAWTTLTFAQAPVQPSEKPAAPVVQGPARIVDVRGQEAISQNLVMGPEATALWKKLQAFIAEPDIQDFARLVALFDLTVSLPLDHVDWRRPGNASRADIRGPDRMIKSGRYAIGVSSGPYPRARFLIFDLEFDIKEFCLSKQEIQRLYATGFEAAPVHSPQFIWPDKTGTAHGFPLANRGGGFEVAASGCVTRYSKSQILETINEEPGK